MSTTSRDKEWWEAIAAADGLVTAIQSFRDEMLKAANNELKSGEHANVAELLAMVEQIQGALECFRQGLEHLQGESVHG